ncbi:hypothetical protein [Nocardia anaemiae]|uniref:hypothetical protein n=1 Tax=Nocardia anaemiae TaxID=263910 RepID=UPI0007A43C05|nr:hypothetical protein [Nocardia anaemiae]
MSEERTPCRESIELRCAGCGEVVSCEGNGGRSIISDLLTETSLGFADLISALMLSGWEVNLSQLVVDGNPRITLMGTPVNEFGRPRLDKRDVTALWEHRPEGWGAAAHSTGFQAIGGGLFRPATAPELAMLVMDSPAVWVYRPR